MPPDPHPPTRSTLEPQIHTICEARALGTRTACGYRTTLHSLPKSLQNLEINPVDGKRGVEIETVSARGDGVW